MVALKDGVPESSLSRINELLELHRHEASHFTGHSISNQPEFGRQGAIPWQDVGIGYCLNSQGFTNGNPARLPRVEMDLLIPIPSSRTVTVSVQSFEGLALDVAFRSRLKLRRLRLKKLFAIG